MQKLMMGGNLLVEAAFVELHGTLDEIEPD